MFKVVQFVGVERSFGSPNLPYHLIPQRPEQGSVGEISPVALFDESFKAWCHPWGIRWVNSEVLNTEEVMMECLCHGGGVVVPLGFYVLSLQNLPPGMVDYPSTKFPQGRVWHGSVLSGDLTFWYGGGGFGRPQYGDV